MSKNKVNPSESYVVELEFKNQIMREAIGQVLALQPNRSAAVKYVLVSKKILQDALAKFEGAGAHEPELTDDDLKDLTS